MSTFGCGARSRGWFQCYQLGTDRGAPAPAGPAPLCPARPQPRAQGDRAPVPGALLSEGNPQPRLFIHRRGPAAAGGGRGGAAGGGHGSRWVRGEGGFPPVTCFCCGLLVLGSLFCGAVGGPCVALTFAAG